MANDGLAGLLAIVSASELAELRASLGIGHGSRVLVVNTEGPTDPESYATICGDRAASADANRPGRSA
ncbi:MAG: hypothetical protein PHU85_13860 [Phycisphaerae bacterium]|nr:hypothetical protein [Phycisphaerae bacterium]